MTQRFRWIVLSAAIGYWLLPTSVPSETYAAGNERMCPNGARVGELHHQYERAYALLDENRFSIAKKLAAALYDCSMAVRDPYEKDVARYFSLDYLALGSFSKGDSEQIAGQCNELAANTRFPDVRKMALKLRDDLRSEE